MVIRRPFDALRASLQRRWDERCGELSVDPTERVEVTGRWASGEVIHSSHRVRVAGVRSRGCVHARPRLNWATCPEPDYWTTICELPNCAAGVARVRPRNAPEDA